MQAFPRMNCSLELIKYGRDMIHRATGARPSNRRSSAGSHTTTVNQVTPTLTDADLFSSRIYSVKNPDTEAGLAQKKRPAYLDIFNQNDVAQAAAQVKRGKRKTCIVCTTQCRYVCSLCEVSVCTSSVERSCFAAHVLQHAMDAGWKAT